MCVAPFPPRRTCYDLLHNVSIALGLVFVLFFLGGFVVVVDIVAIVVVVGRDHREGRQGRRA